MHAHLRRCVSADSGVPSRATGVVLRPPAAELTREGFADSAQLINFFLINCAESANVNMFVSDFISDMHQIWRVLEMRYV